MQPGAVAANIEWFYDLGSVCTSDGAFLGAVALQLDVVWVLCIPAF